VNAGLLVDLINGIVLFILSSIVFWRIYFCLYAS
jgi:hypothetical protein